MHDVDNLVHSDQNHNWLQYLVGLVSFSFMLSTSLRSIGINFLFVLLMCKQEHRQQLLRLVTQPWMLIVFIWLSWILISGFWSDASNTVILSLYKKYIKLLYLPFFVILMQQALCRWFAIQGLILGVAFSAMISCCVYFQIPGFVALNSDHVFVNHVEYSIFAAVSVMLLLSQCFTNKLTNASFYYCFLFLLLSFHTFWVSGGRMGYMIFFASVLVSLMFWASWRQIAWVMFGLVIIVVLGFEFSPMFHNRLYSLVYELQTYQDPGSSMNAIGHRFQFHNLARQLWMHHPLIGSGIGAFSHEVLSKNLFPFMEWGRLADPHSQYWWILAEQGCIGLLIYSAFLISLLYQSCLNRDSLGLLTGLCVIYLIAQSADTLLFSTTLSELFLLVIAIGLAPTMPIIEDVI